MKLDFKQIYSLSLLLTIIKSIKTEGEETKKEDKDPLKFAKDIGWEFFFLQNLISGTNYIYHVLHRDQYLLLICLWKVLGFFNYSSDFFEKCKIINLRTWLKKKKVSHYTGDQHPTNHKLILKSSFTLPMFILLENCYFLIDHICKQNFSNL